MFSRSLREGSVSSRQSSTFFASSLRDVLNLPESLQPVLPL